MLKVTERLRFLCLQYIFKHYLKVQGANCSKVVNMLYLKVMEAEQTKSRSELLHKETAARYNAAMSHMKQLEKKLKRTISKSK